jgi:hypothetical protein
MPCRVGITTDPEDKKAFWRTECLGFAHWRVLAKFATRKKARDYEMTFAKEHCCTAEPGGLDVDGSWYVYQFEFVSQLTAPGRWGT